MKEVQTGPWPGWDGPVTVELADDAAVALFSAVAAYRANTGRRDADVAPIIMPVGGLRTVAEVTEMLAAFRLHERGASGWQATYSKYNMSTASTAAPSLYSPHLTGYCADIAPKPFFDWMVANGSRYGWKQTLAQSGDPRHFQFFPGTATAALNIESLDGGAATNSPKEPHMFIVDATKLQDYRNGTWLMAPGYAHGFTPAEWNDWGQNLQTAGVWVFTPTTDAGFDSLLSSLTNDRRPFPGAGVAGLPGAGPVTVNAQVDVTPELVTALKDPGVLAALAAAIKVPTKIESTLS